MMYYIKITDKQSQNGILATKLIIYNYNYILYTLYIIHIDNIPGVDTIYIMIIICNLHKYL